MFMLIMLGLGNPADHLTPQRVKLPRFSSSEMEHASIKCGGKHVVFHQGSQM